MGLYLFISFYLFKLVLIMVVFMGSLMGFRGLVIEVFKDSTVLQVVSQLITNLFSFSFSFLFPLNSFKLLWIFKFKNSIIQKFNHPNTTSSGDY